MGNSRLGGFELLAQDAADHAHRGVMMLRDRAFGDSPIECLFFAALTTEARKGHRVVDDILPVTERLPLSSGRESVRRMGNPLSTAFIERQVQVAGWRVDFVLHYPAFGNGDDEAGEPILSRLLIECDGHDFHERTKEQAARDRSRDRAAQHEGLPILRFTGSEIWSDPMFCADTVLAFMERA